MSTSKNKNSQRHSRMGRGWSQSTTSWIQIFRNLWGLTNWNRSFSIAMMPKLAEEPSSLLECSWLLSDQKKWGNLLISTSASCSSLARTYCTLPLVTKPARRRSIWRSLSSYSTKLKLRVSTRLRLSTLCSLPKKSRSSWSIILTQLARRSTSESHRTWLYLNSEVRFASILTPMSQKPDCSSMARNWAKDTTGTWFTHWI